MIAGPGKRKGASLPNRSGGERMGSMDIEMSPRLPGATKSGRR
jgi:hypothetical protein